MKKKTMKGIKVTTGDKKATTYEVWKSKKSKKVSSKPMAKRLGY